MPPKPSIPDADRYLFDLNGFVVVRGVFTPEEVKAANEAIDKRSLRGRENPALRNTDSKSPLAGDGVTPRQDLGGVLTWKEDSAVFRRVLDHPKLMPYYHEFLGEGYRMDHLPFVIAQDKGAEGFALHGGTVDCSSGKYNHDLAYTYAHGSIHCNLMAVSLVLADHNAGSGGFCVVRGSHKSNLKAPTEMINGHEEYKDVIHQPITKAGDVVMFSEGTVHGALPWTEDYQRRICLFRFAPPGCAYGRSYFEAGECSWPKGLYDGELTDTQRAVLEPPYANRLDRPQAQADGSIKVSSRNAVKKAFDKEVFGSKYF